MRWPLKLHGEYYNIPCKKRKSETQVSDFQGSTESMISMDILYHICVFCQGGIKKYLSTPRLVFYRERVLLRKGAMLFLIFKYDEQKRVFAGGNIKI